MVVRDRTQELATRANGIQTRLTFAEVVVQTCPVVDTNLGKFLDQVNMLMRLLDKLDSQVENVDVLQRKILDDEDEVESPLLRELDKLNTEIKQEMVNIRTGITNLSRLPLLSSSHVDAICSQQHAHVGERFKEIRIKYLNNQVKFVEGQEEFKREFTIISYTELNEVENVKTEVVEDGDWVMMTQFDNRDSAYLRNYNRHMEFLHLEKSFQELSNLFSEMIEIIDDQDKKVCKIEESSENTQYHVHQAGQQIRKSAMKKSLKGKIWMYSVAIAVLLGIIVILTWTIYISSL